MSSTLIPVTVTLTKTNSPLPSANAPYANTGVVITDSTGSAQPVVYLTGSETPAWSFTTSVAAGSGTAVATDYDTAGAVIGTPITATFTEAGTAPTGPTGPTGTQATFPATSAITVTPTASSTSALNAGRGA